MEKGVRVGVRIPDDVDDEHIEQAISLLQNAAIAERQQNGLLTDEQKSQLKGSIDHIRSLMKNPDSLDLIATEPLVMMGVE